MSRIIFDGAPVPARFLEVDEGDVTRRRVTTEGAELADLTPLAGLELIEQLHAARNTLRRQAGLAEVAQNDVMLVLLAFVRRLENEAICHLGQLAHPFAEVVREIQERRLEHVGEGVRE